MAARIKSEAVAAAAAAAAAALAEADAQAEAAVGWSGVQVLLVLASTRGLTLNTSE